MWFKFFIILGVSSKTFRSPYVSLSRYRPRYCWMVQVGDFLNFRFVLCQPVGYYIAGIGYELVASVCTKGKRCVTYLSIFFKLKLFPRGFLRKAKSVVVSTISPITIDKHELHSTWPVYCQPETRHVAQDGVNLSVQRNNTCYGPGDRISVTVTVKSDSVHSIIFRTLELSLKETTVFRAGALGPGKRVPPQERRINIAESKVPVNITLYGGSSHGAELSCLLSPAHTTTTLNAARHIDITYTICIKALLSTGAPLVMELPVIISNWQR